METRTAFQAVAAELSAAFETATRTNGAAFVRFKADAPAWIESDRVAHGFHLAVDDRAPNDWIYSAAAKIADRLSDYDSADDARDAVGEIVSESVIDIYSSDLLAWAGDDRNAAIADEWADEGGLSANRRSGEGFSALVDSWAKGGQSLAGERIAAAIIDAIETEAGRRDS